MSDMDEQLDKFERLATALLEAQPKGNTNHANITVSAGGVGTWICCTACLIMLSMNLFLGYLYIDESRKSDRMQDCINVILQWAPQLKDLVNQTMKDKGVH